MSPIFHRTGDKKRAFERMHLATSRLKIFIWPGDSNPEPLQGFGFMSDLSESGVGVYVGRKLSPATSALIAFERADNVTYRGMVVWCNRFSLSQSFLGHDALNFRAGIKYLFSSEAERQRYLEYFAQLKARASVLKPGMDF